MWRSMASAQDRARVGDQPASAGCDLRFSGIAPQHSQQPLVTRQHFKTARDTACVHDPQLHGKRSGIANVEMQFPFDIESGWTRRVTSDRFREEDRSRFGAAQQG